MKRGIRLIGCLLLFALMVLSSRQEVVRAQEPPPADTVLYLPMIQDSFACSSVTEIPQSECEALVALWYATNPVLPDGTQSWLWTDGWLKTSTPCSWFGITCENGHVSYIALVNNRVTGGLPPEIGNLSSLQQLVLPFNSLSSLPAEIGNLGSLQSLSLSNNQLSSLPAEIVNLSLESLTLDDNCLVITNPDIVAFLDARAPGWQAQQRPTCN